MLKIIKALLLQKNQLIKNVRTVKMRDNFKGLPVINPSANVVECEKVCPTGAFKDGKIDLGKCTFCCECERVSGGEVTFTTNNRMGVDKRENLLTAGEINPMEVREKIKKMFGRSLKLRQVSAGGCNSCEMELNACSNANFDIGRFGIEFVASPRHADGIVITGPVTKNMAKALEETFEAVAEPKIIVVVGACAISGGIYQDSEEIDRSFFEKHTPDLYIPGCPAHPLVIANAILDYLGRK